jgi:hypothetical protein
MPRAMEPRREALKELAALRDDNLISEAEWETLRSRARPSVAEPSGTTPKHQRMLRDGPARASAPEASMSPTPDGGAPSLGTGGGKSRCSFSGSRGDYTDGRWLPRAGPPPYRINMSLWEAIGTSIRRSTPQHYGRCDDAVPNRSLYEWRPSSCGRPGRQPSRDPSCFKCP